MKSNFHNNLYIKITKNKTFSNFLNDKLSILKISKKLKIKTSEHFIQKGNFYFIRIFIIIILKKTF